MTLRHQCQACDHLWHNEIPLQFTSDRHKGGQINKEVRPYLCQTVRRPATCRRTESAPTAFFNVQRPCRPINQTRYCRRPCLSGRRQSLMEQSANWCHVRNRDACFLFSFKNILIFCFLPCMTCFVYNVDSPSAFAVCISLGHLKYFNVM